MSNKIDKKKLAIVLLAYADFEAIEIALAAFSKTLKDDMKLFNIIYKKSLSKVGEYV